MVARNGKAISGIIWSATEIITESTNIIKFKHNMKKGEKIWIKYNVHGKLTGIEPKTQDGEKTGESGTAF